MTRPSPNHAALVARLEAGEISNELDVLIEVALFADAEPNSAGTKVVYSNEDGTRSTHWAPDHCLDPEQAITALKTVAARAQALSGEVNQSNAQEIV